MQWIRDNLSSLVLFLLAIGMAGYAVYALSDSLKNKCIFVSLEDGASVKISSLEMTGPSSYRSFAKDCGYVESVP